MQQIARRELFQAQFALLVAIALQAVVWRINHDLFSLPQYLIIVAELVLVFIVGLATAAKTFHQKGLHHNAAIILLGIMSTANITALALVIYSLIAGSATREGIELLASALAILMTNIIVYALWYWEIDSPGLTQKRWSKADKDFEFTQQEHRKEFPNWKPEFIDYLYLSVTNAINFAPADTKPVTRGAKLLMGSQALVSVLTLALVIARSVSILGS